MAAKYAEEEEERRSYLKNEGKVDHSYDGEDERHGGARTATRRSWPDIGSEVRVQFSKKMRRKMELAPEYSISAILSMTAHEWRRGIE